MTHITQTLKPSSANYWKGTAFTTLFVIPFIAFQIIWNAEKPGVWIAFLAALIGSLIGVGLYFARARILIDESQLGKQRIVGTRWIPFAEIDRALLVRGYNAFGQLPSTELFLFAADGRKLLRMRGRLWAEPDQVTLATATGATPGVMAGPVTAKDIHAVEPNAIAWVERHPFLAAFAITFALLIVLVPLVVVLN